MFATLQKQYPQDVWITGDEVILTTPVRKIENSVGEVVKVRGPAITFRVYKSKEKFVKNLTRRFGKKLNWLKILPKYNHPLTKIFKEEMPNSIPKPTIRQNESIGIHGELA